jgi:hypothetical protein
MANALFGFEQRAAAQNAVDRLLKEGFSPSAVQLHVDDDPNREVAEEVDELVTGGFVGNFLALFQGIFEWGKTNDAAAYAEIVRHGGAVVSVDARSDAERAKVDKIMLEASCGRRTDWSTVPTS